MQQLDQTGFSGYADCPNTVVWLTSHHSTSQHIATLCVEAQERHERMEKI